MSLTSPLQIFSKYSSICEITFKVVRPDLEWKFVNPSWCRSLRKLQLGVQEGEGVGGAGAAVKYPDCDIPAILGYLP